MTFVRPFIIDCDTGRDDALAIWSCVLSGYPLAAVMSSYGNSSIDNVVENNLRVLSCVAAGNIPVFVGASCGSKIHLKYDDVVLSRHRTQGNGLADVELPCASTKPQTNFIDWLRSYTPKNGKIDYMIIGPATNFMNLCDALGNEIHDYIYSVTMMGGKLNPLWDELPNGADFNIAADPYAVSLLLENNIPVSFVPMNATYSVFLDLGELNDLNPKSKVGEWAKKIMIDHVEKFAPEPYFRFHDPMVPFAMQRTDAFSKMNISICLDENSNDFGRLTECDNGHEVSFFQPSNKDRKDILNQILSLFFEQ